MIEKNELIKFLNLEQKFNDYLIDPSNKQMLFSGPFGSGKTTFLKNFFIKTNEEIKENYTVIHLYPVNYSLHNNTDIYEILKYDIILELIGLGAFKAPDITNLLKYTFAVSQTVDKNIGKFISLFSETGKKLVELIELSIESFKSINKDASDLNDPLHQVRNFGEIIDKIKGYDYEDYITSVIKEKLATLETKQKILIIDDLDRFDPEHLFRLISIFSAHIDHQTDENKFGFDKIIFVGDLQNIKEMFEHKYGIKTAFNGFISKLSSKYPFEYDPKRELYNEMPKLLDQFNIAFNGKSNEQLFGHLNKTEQKFINYMVCSLINCGLISLREIQKKKQIAIKIKYNFDSVSHNELPLRLFCDFIYHILVDKIKVIDCINNLLTQTLDVDELRGEGNKNHYIADLSRVPLTFIHKTTCADLGNVNRSIAYSTDSSKNLHLTFYKLPESRNNLICSIEDPNLNEKDIILFTIEALKKMEDIIK